MSAVKEYCLAMTDNCPPPIPGSPGMSTYRLVFFCFRVFCATGHRFCTLKRFIRLSVFRETLA